MGETTHYSGKTKMNNGDLFIDGNRVFTIIDIKDTLGNKWNWITYCGYNDAAEDSLKFDKILTTDRCILYHFI